MDGYKIPPVMFTQVEANALITAEHLIMKNKDQSLTEHYESAITKIKSVLRCDQIEKTELLTNRLQVRNNHTIEKTSSYLIKLQSTISICQIIKIDYLSLENNRTVREVEPFALYTTQENWILNAFCRLKNNFRGFRLDCIVKMRF